MGRPPDGRGPGPGGPTGQPTLGAALFAWLFTAIGMVLLVRLVLVAYRAAGMAVGWLSEGNVLERISINPLDMSPLSLAINLAIPAIVLTLFVISRLVTSHGPPDVDASASPPTDTSR